MDFGEKSGGFGFVPSSSSAVGAAASDPVSNFLKGHNSSTSNEDSLVRGSGSGAGGDTDPDDEEPPWATAPPNEYIDFNIKGYELVSFDALNVPPPLDLSAFPASVVNGGGNGSGGEDASNESPAAPPAAAAAAPPPPPIVLECDTRISEDEAQSALLTYLSSNHCCYGKKAARNMTIKNMECLPAFHYELQTFSEKRETAWTYAPIKAGFPECGGYGGGGGGSPPLPWDIEEFPTQPFKDEVRLIPVPNTSNVKSCHRCRGTGGVLCKDCNGKGWFRCMHCHGDGWLSDSGGSRERCFYCQHSKHGHGQQDCSKCNTKGKVNCATCDGQGQVRCYIQLSITWKVHTAEHIVERFALPHELIRDVSGQVAVEEETTKLSPLRVSDKDISEASARLVNNHANAFADQKIVAQRHQVRIVPVTHVQYEWKAKQHSFFVYGYENKTHLKKYPLDCCWGCQLL